MLSIPTIKDLKNLEGKRVLLRADFNVPLKKDSQENFQVADDFRIRAAFPTIDYLLGQGASVTICTHLGRPKGEHVKKWEIAPVAEVLHNHYPDVKIMENLRFDIGEEKNDEAFVKKLIENQDVFVNDAFGVSHRAHASIVGPPKFLPSAAGFLIEEELSVLCKLLNGPAKPFIAIVGGAKISDKLGVVGSLAKVADYVLIGGAMSFSFLKAQGHGVGDSMVEDEMLPHCVDLMKEFNNIVLPEDSMALTSEGDFGDCDHTGEVRYFNGDIEDGYRGLDIGSFTVEKYLKYIKEAGTIFWNGPMGVCEDERFSKGTQQIAQGVVDSKAYSVIGGGDSAKALSDFHLNGHPDYVSTGGGASLEFLEFGDLPGIKALRESIA